MVFFRARVCGCDGRTPVSEVVHGHAVMFRVPDIFCV